MFIENEFAIDDKSSAKAENIPNTCSLFAALV